MRPLLAICLFAALSLQFTTRLSGYVNCMVTAYIADHKDFAEDCGCAHYIAQAFDGQGNNNQLQPSAPVLKLQDYMPTHSWPALAALPAPASTPPLMAPCHYSKGTVTDVFRPPCITASLS